MASQGPGWRQTANGKGDTEAQVPLPKFPGIRSVPRGGEPQLANEESTRILNQIPLYQVTNFQEKGN